MDFNEYLPSGAMIGNIELDKVFWMKKVWHDIKYSVLLQCSVLPLILLIYFVKSYAREAHLRDILSIQPELLELLKEIAGSFRLFLVFAKSYV